MSPIFVVLFMALIAVAPAYDKRQVVLPCQAGRGRCNPPKMFCPPELPTNCPQFSCPGFHTCCCP